MNLKYCYIDGAIEGMGMDFIVIAEYPEINYTLIRRNSTYEPYVAAWGLNWETGNWDQGHYFSTINEAVLYIEEKILVKNNDLNDDEKEKKTMTKEEVITAVREMGITAAEIGFLPMVEKDESFVDDVRKMIHGLEIDPSDAREYIAEEYWEDLRIEEEKYKVVEVTMSQTVYKTVRVVMPIDEETEDAGEYVDTYDMEYYETVNEDEEDWEVFNCELYKDKLTEKDVENIDCLANEVDDL